MAGIVYVDEKEAYEIREQIKKDIEEEYEKNGEPSDDFINEFGEKYNICIPDDLYFNFDFEKFQTCFRRKVMEDDIDREVRKIINELKGTIEVIEKLQKENLIFLKSRIKYIIENKITDIKEIEIILDQLLIQLIGDYKSVRKNFNKIINYYKKVDTKKAKFYQDYYIKIEEQFLLKLFLKAK